VGAVTTLLLLPITGPVLGFTYMIGALHNEAEAVLRDEGRAFAELIDLSMRHNAGQLSDEEFAEMETELFERLSSIRDYWNDLVDGETDSDEQDWQDESAASAEEEEW
jgi:hypothetical protein